MQESGQWSTWRSALWSVALIAGSGCSAEPQAAAPAATSQSGAGQLAAVGGNAGTATSSVTSVAGLAAGATATARGGAPGSTAGAGMSGSSRPDRPSTGAAGRGMPVVTGGAGAGAAGSPASTTPPSGPMAPLDCGMNGVAIENAGPPKNRVNYVIVGDGYTAAQQETFVAHVQKAMTKRFSEVIGQPYGRYRKFVNICAIKLVSQNGPIGSGATALDCTGDDQSRLAKCNSSKVNMALMANLPTSFEVDWKAVVLNNDRWWNTGATIMLWSGAHKDAAGAALHEGGHGFHQLADEYNGSDTNCSKEFGEVNVTADNSKTAGKWDMWLGWDQAGATGVQGAISGARYCMSGQYRPSQNSMMNQLFGDKPNTAYNPVSREKMIMDIWRAVTPVDMATPAAGKLDKPGMLQVKVIDPAVVDVDWSIDDKVVAAKGGESFDLSAQTLAPGAHTITALAYDNAGMELVRYEGRME